MLSVCSHVLREHGHPTDKEKTPNFIKIADFREHLKTETLSSENPKLYKELQNEERAISKKIGVYKKRQAAYLKDGKESLADKQAIKIEELEIELLKTQEKLKKFYSFTKTAAKKSTVKFVEFVFTWTQTPPTDINAKEITEAAMEFLNTLGQDLYSGVVVSATHLDQSSIHTHVITELNFKWADVLKSINPNPREAFATINERWSEFCQEKFKHYDFGEHIGGNKYLKLNEFKKLSAVESQSPLTKMKMGNLVHSNEQLSNENRTLKNNLGFIIKMKKTPLIIRRIVDSTQIQKLKDFLSGIVNQVQHTPVVKVTGIHSLTSMLKTLSKAKGFQKNIEFGKYLR